MTAIDDDKFRELPTRSVRVVFAHIRSTAVNLAYPTRRVAILVWLATSPAALGAQEPRRLAQPDSIPLDLATSLMAAGSVGSEPQILVGALPEWFAQRIVVPSGARILGAAFQGTAVVGIASVPGTVSESLLAGVRRDLLGRGWKNPPTPPNYGGFRPAPSTVEASR